MHLPRLLWPLLAALALLTVSWLKPTWPMQQDVFRYLFVLDITQSMNARDYHHPSLPPDRLSFAKASVKHALQHLPCGSRVSLGIFSTKNVILLFEPLEICEHFAVIDSTLAHIDWRMAWAGDSYVERGLYGSILEVKDIPEEQRPAIVFLSDGEQTATELHRPPLDRMMGLAQGFVIGVGGTTPVSIPKLGPDNQPTGEFWKNSEIPAIAETQSRPRSRPAGIPIAVDPSQIFKSQLQELALQEMAVTTGFRYHRLQNPEDFSLALQAHELAQQQLVEQDIRWLLAALAILLLALPYVPALRRFFA